MTDFSNGLKNNSDMLISIGAGLLAGKTPAEQIGLGLTNASNERKYGQMKNQTLKWLQDNNPDLANLMSAGVLDPKDAVKLAWDQRLQSQKPKSYDFQTLPNGDYGTFDPTTGAFNKIGSAPKIGADGQPKFGNSPIYGKDEQGNVIILQPGDNGTLAQPKIPDGVKILGPGDKAYDAAQGKTLGGAAGSAQTQIDGAQQVADQVANTVADIKNSSSLDNVLGPFDSRIPNILPGSNDVQAKIDQLKGSAFLQARQLLKGGGAITDFEGKKAEEAMARLNQAQSPEAFKAALDDFNNAVQQGVAKLRSQAGGNFGGAPAMAPAAPGKTATGVGWSIEGN